MNGLGVLTGLLGIFALVFGILLISRRNKCNTLIQGVFINHYDYSGSSVHSYAPIFRYNYNSINYENQSIDVISKQLADAYISGKTYPIYVNSNRPNEFVVSKKFNGADICMIGFGIFFILFSIIFTLIN